jgi:HEAT repeat protein
MGPAARDAVPALLAALNDKGSYGESGFPYIATNDVFVSDAAGLALVRIGGPEAATGLAHLLRSGDCSLVDRAAKLLGQMNGQPDAKAAVPGIIAALDGANRGSGGCYPTAIVDLLANFGLEPGTPEAQAAIPVLKSMFERFDDANIILNATALFHRLVPDDPAPIAALIRVLGNDYKGEVNLQVVTALAQYGKPAVQPLIAALGYRQPPVGAGAIQALAKMPAEDTVVPLQQALSNKDATVRANSAKALGLLGQPAAAAVPDLKKLAANKDEPAFVRIQAARALWVIDHNVPASFPVLVAGSRDTNQFVRSEAEQALQQIGPQDEWAAEDLAKALQDKDKNVRIEAAKVLGQIGPAAKRVLPLMLEAVNDPEPDVRLAVAKGVAKVDGK